MYKLYEVCFDDGNWRSFDITDLVIATSKEEAIRSWSRYQHYKDLGLLDCVHAWEYKMKIDNEKDFDVNIDIAKKGE